MINEQLYSITFLGGKILGVSLTRAQMLKIIEEFAPRLRNEALVIKKEPD